jgi:two-component system, cell cycle response regulator
MPPSSESASARILIVDDQPSNVRLLEHTLKRGGYVEVSSTMDPAEVVALHAQKTFDLILLDLQMPNVNGFEVMKRLRALDGAHAIILVISADPSQKEAALAGGANSFMKKPFVLADVVARVEELLKKNQT